MKSHLKLSVKREMFQNISAAQTHNLLLECMKNGIRNLKRSGEKKSDRDTV